MNFNQIFENNQQWVAQKLDNDENYFENLAKGQNPELLFIGCSDSRVAPELFMGAEPGDIFVHRNIGNVVPNSDSNSRAVINYSVCHLKIPHIVICGHYGCGGVKAAMGSDDLGALNPWLKNIRDVRRLHCDELENIVDEDSRYKRLVELNVQEQCINLLKIAEVQQAYKNDELAIHGWVFDIQSGKLIDLKIDLDEVLEDIFNNYKLS